MIIQLQKAKPQLSEGEAWDELVDVCKTVVACGYTSGAGILLPKSAAFFDLEKAVAGYKAAEVAGRQNKRGAE